ncbi:MAG: bifunctional aldolase/short-chain dehydrogenase [Nitrospirae bacterium]|nr:bifunctional aldolase/short-chain dehydrogenase [Nitrospirota bacterium]
MENRWDENGLARVFSEYALKWGYDLPYRIYSSRLMGSDRRLVLHGGGNTSVKTTFTNVLGDTVPAIYVKASGYDMATIGEDGFAGLDLQYLLRLKALREMSDEEMVNEFRTHLFDYRCPTPSLETLLHVFLHHKFIDHTHPDSILTLTNQFDGEKILKEAIGEDVIIIKYITPGFKLAKAALTAYESNPSSRAMVLMHHGLITWGETAKSSYDLTIELVNRAEQYIKARSKPVSAPVPEPEPEKPSESESGFAPDRQTAHSETESGPVVKVSADVSRARANYLKVAPIVRGLLATRTKDPDRPYDRVILQPLVDGNMLAFVDSERGRELALTPPITTDYLVRIKAFPMWVSHVDFGDENVFRELFKRYLDRYAGMYDEYVRRNAPGPSASPNARDTQDTRSISEHTTVVDVIPRVIFIPGLGAICAGTDVESALIALDITGQSVEVKSSIASMGTYATISEAEIFNMEYRSYQQAKLGSGKRQPLQGHVAVITGAAGAIGSAISRELLSMGCHLAITDLPGDPLDSLMEELKKLYCDRVMAVPMDVTSPASVHEGFDSIVARWGGVDLVIPNAGIALVATIDQMRLEDFRKLEMVNVEGTLLVLYEAGRIFKTQATGGDVVLISTKNVFAPGAGFGAYSATKAAAHQIAKIASLEFASMDVRVNMVAPDAVFSEGDRRSGLWAQVGPQRMKARGLDEKGLEEYYINRNLLKVRITGKHVARAVMYFATRQTPTTGATIPVDGGLPEATPR